MLRWVTVCLLACFGSSTQSRAFWEEGIPIEELLPPYLFVGKCVGTFSWKMIENGPSNSLRSAIPGPMDPGDMKTEAAQTMENKLVTSTPP